MKKFITAVAFVLVAAMSCVFLVGCSSELSAGTYKFSKMSGKMQGMEIDVSVGDELMGMLKLTEDYMTLEIKEDGTAVMSVMGETVDCAWEKKDGKYYLTVDGESQEMTVKKNTISFENDGMKVELKK